MPTSNYCWLLYFWLNLYCIFSLYISNFPKKCQIGYLNCRCRLKVRDPSICVLKVQNFCTKYFLNSYWILMQMTRFFFTKSKSTYPSVEQFKVLVFCYQNCSDILWEKIALVIKKNSQIFEITRTICSNSERSEQLLF